MLSFRYDYASVVRHAERVCWTIDEVMPPGTRLDFTRPFLPELLEGSARIPGLAAPERLKLNHIAGHAYIHLFAFLEEYIVAMAVSRAQAEMHGDHDAIRALVRFAEEELKHQKLFFRFLDTFKEGFGHPCWLVGDAATVAREILSKSPIAVLLMTLHIEMLTQTHYAECARHDDKLEPLFVSLLEHHWLEEAQHAKLDALELAKLVAEATPEGVRRGFDDYLSLVGVLDRLLAVQAGLDLSSLGGAIGRVLPEAQAEDALRAQHAAYRGTFLVLGMKNRLFVDIASRISPEGAARVAERARALALALA
jgi:hypothetical protein